VRLFFAVHLGADVLARVAAYVEALREKARDRQLAWATPEKLHYTLKFLGEVDVDPLHMEALQRAVEVARDVSPFELAPGALGVFPDESSPRVLWLGVEEGAEALCVLAAKLEAHLAREGYPRDVRPYRPHLTLARTKGRAGARALSRLIASAPPRIDFGRTRIERFALMQSIGGTYRERLAFVLGGAGGAS
jgi:2'-5' RNA ligase